MNDLQNATVTVLGAYGHTGRFVVAELVARGFVPILAGRDQAKLDAFAAAYPDLDVRLASADDAASLDRALAGADAVINAAGPFAATAAPVIEAALRARIPYVDVAAEIEANTDTFRLFADRAREAGIVVLPAMAFYGGLGDLLATAAMDDWTEADEVHIAYGLDGWHPTSGTRATGAVSRRRNGGRHVRYTGGELTYHDDERQLQKWSFPEPTGVREVFAEFSMADVVTVPSHLPVPEVCTYMAVEAARDLMSPDTPEPVAVSEDGRSAQLFVVEAVVVSGLLERSAVASGRDIYAVSAPLAVEAVHRILTGQTTTTAGVASAGALFDAADVLHALAPHLTVDLRTESVPGRLEVQ
ncbi:saccharopine dehydrogenase NADP-binding domain-containing protein [Actinomadura rupiterrae]|uniref:saccharopine dehydrogenase NADP-binding domain-containing protein n=1 Tax=Actinomadura rupiterrae TaxID=559627 RepID=UPI0020A415E3|nr:saccharopine dehydrogenase NADP-binding domain-containing protein [Actinomadura rupiterrae]MCP2341572.1 NAD(P)-dependent dehydrogenase (short-subunit alcohol dehydrogenase family) [Actinomadura rupiterrae]